MKIAVALAIMLAPVALYLLVIRPRLQARFTDIYADLDGFWARVWARLYAFRSFAVASLGAVVAGLPLLLESLAGVDFSFLPEPWPAYVSVGVSVALTLIRAFATTPGEEPPA